MINSTLMFVMTTYGIAHGHDDCDAPVRCAVKVPKTVEMWAEELRAANAAVNGGTDTKVSKFCVSFLYFVV